MSKKKEKKKATCKQCGEDFIQRRDWQVFCGKACRWANWNDRNPRVKRESIKPEL